MMEIVHNNHTNGDGVVLGVVGPGFGTSRRKTSPIFAISTLEIIHIELKLNNVLIKLTASYRRVFPIYQLWMIQAILH